MSPAPPSDRAVWLSGVHYAPSGGPQLLDDFEVSLSKGQVLALVGRSGCGKSTLLRVVAGLARPARGEVRTEGRPAFVFQSPTLLPWRSLRRNVSLPLELSGEHDEARVEAALARVGLSEAAERLPHQLSGGMRMRASLARALVTRPGLLLMDEPFSAVDALTRAHLHEEFSRLQAELGFSAVLVTHDIEEAVRLADVVKVLSGPPLRVENSFEVSFSRPRSPDLVYEPGFVALVRALRQAMERVP